MRRTYFEFLVMSSLIYSWYLGVRLFDKWKVCVYLWSPRARQMFNRPEAVAALGWRCPLRVRFEDISMWASLPHPKEASSRRSEHGFG